MKNCFKKDAGRILLAISGLLLLLKPTPVNAAQPMDARTLALINKPAVVLIEATWTADVVIDEVGVDTEILDVVDAALVQLNQEGRLDGTMEQLTSAYMQLFTQFLPDYSTPSGSYITSPVETSFIGTGMIVSQDGYLLTNAHLVEADEQELFMDFAYELAAEYVLDQVQSFSQSLYSETNVMPSQEDMDALAECYYLLLVEQMQVNNLSSGFSGYLGASNGAAESTAKPVPLEVRKKGEAIPGKDIAILKMDRTNLPTVSLGDDALLKTGDTIYAMGYPAVATVNGTLDVSQAILEPTLTSGIVSARKQMAGGWSILQIDADIHGGNSGGPLLNTAGEVVGINTFGAIDESGASASGMNFAIPITLAKEFLRELNVTPTESEFTAAYREAVVAYSNADYRSAAKLLRHLNELSPGVPAVVELLSECTRMAEAQPASAILGGSSFTMIGLPWWIFAVGGGVIVLIFVLALVVHPRKKAKRSDNKPESTAQPDTAQIDLFPPIAPASPAEGGNTVCTHCGAARDGHDLFCGNCGNRFS